jgi:hypothetical protein
VAVGVVLAPRVLLVLVALVAGAKAKMEQRQSAEQ